MHVPARPISWFVAAALIGLAAIAWADQPKKTLVFDDPKGDDNGPGTYVYPTDAAYAPGSFDLRKVEIEDKGDNIEIRVTLASRISDPWTSKDWDGNGFSLQFVQIYIDTDHKKGSGFTTVLPGLGGLQVAEDEAWDKVVLISPQPKSRLSAEVRYKAGKMKDAVIIPLKTSARGKTLIARIPKQALGQPAQSWGWQVAMQSNEGYPVGGDILSRPVNEVRGEHRFGGGDDTACDPQVLDILAGAAKGEATEIGAQHKALAWKCGSQIARMPMIYPAAAR